MFVTTRRAADPFPGIRRLNQMLDDAFTSNWFADSNTSSAMTAGWIPACDVFEDRDGIKIVAELPGVRVEDVKLSVENNVLTIRGEKKQVAEEKAERVHRYERTYGTFERTFALPSTVDVEGIDAAYDAGLLTVTLPKAERARPREIQVRALSDNGAQRHGRIGEGRTEA
jgi:HSP20 family protein